MDVDVSSDDLSVLLYNYAVLLSGALAVDTFALDDRTTLMGLMLLFALFWTIYFRIGMLHRFTADEEDEDGEAVTEPDRASR